MMKKITFLMLILSMTFGHAQQLLVDFEGGAYGGTLSYSPEDGDCPGANTGVFEQKANPVSTGNPSATAAQIITDTAGQPWQNAQLFLDAGDEIDLTGSTKTVSIKIYSEIATDILAKVVDGPSGGGATGSEVATDASHTGSGWETLVFDFNDFKDCAGTGNYCGPAFEVYSRILFFPLWNEGGAGFGGGTYCGDPEPLQEIWIDDIVNNGILSTEKNELLNFSIFPNPTRDNWVVKSQNSNIESIQVFDVMGKNILTLSPLRNEATIDGSSLTRGMYFAKIETASGTSSLKLIKQ